ncbi:MAG: HipA domain-containing protein [Deltaproteobacteria bacterium]|nr:HipA domain-containing protein [Deltaproteobacteria bacterium]
MTARCLSTLVPMEEEGFSRSAQRALSGGSRQVPHQLGFNRVDAVDFHMQHVDGFSISGAQVKVSLRLHRGVLSQCEMRGEFILKPVPTADLAYVADAPANEHLTMLIAERVYGIRVATNGLVRFADGELAYLTRRFDRRGDTPIPQEDFAQIAGRSSATHGPTYKYDGSYEALGGLVRRYVAAHRVELEKLFRQLVFNYALSNGDAHLKNFSLYRSEHGDYVLTPAYDLMCTRLHLPNESRLALELFDAYESPGFEANGFHTGVCFRELARRYGLLESRAERILESILAGEAHVLELIERSFLSEPAKVRYRGYYIDRLRALRA